MRPALARHDEILRRAVIEHRGEPVKTTGDGLMAAFSSVSDCVAACLQAQRELSDADWGIPEHLRVRMGVHVGEAELGFQVIAQASVQTHRMRNGANSTARVDHEVVASFAR